MREYMSENKCLRNKFFTVFTIFCGLYLQTFVVGYDLSNWNRGYLFVNPRPKAWNCRK